MKRNKLMALTALLTIFATPSSKAQEVKGGSKQSTSAQSSNKDSKNAFVGSMMSIGYGWIKNNLPWLITAGITTSVSGAVGNKMGKKKSDEFIREKISAGKLFDLDKIEEVAKQQAGATLMNAEKKYTADEVGIEADKIITQKLTNGEFIKNDEGSVKRAVEKFGLKYTSKDIIGKVNNAVNQLLRGGLLSRPIDQNKKANFNKFMNNLGGNTKPFLEVLQKQFKLDFQVNVVNMAVRKKINGKWGEELEGISDENIYGVLCMLADLRNVLVDGQLDGNDTNHFDVSFIKSNDNANDKRLGLLDIVYENSGGAHRKYRVCYDLDAGDEGDAEITIILGDEAYVININGDKGEDGGEGE